MISSKCYSTSIVAEEAAGGERAERTAADFKSAATVAGSVSATQSVVGVEVATTAATSSTSFIGVVWSVDSIDAIEEDAVGATKLEGAAAYAIDIAGVVGMSAVVMDTIMSCIMVDAVAEDLSTEFAAEVTTVIYIAANILSGSSLAAAKRQKLIA